VLLSLAVLVSCLPGNVGTPADTRRSCRTEFAWNEFITKRRLWRPRAVAATRGPNAHYQKVSLFASDDQKRRLASEWFRRATPQNVGTSEDVLVLCAVRVTDRRGLDPLPFVIPLDRKTGVQINSAPDLKVRIQIGDQTYQNLPAYFSDATVVPLRARLRPNMSIEVRAEDFDLFSKNDFIGRAVTQYQGRFPLRLRDRRLAVECRAVSPADRQRAFAQTSRAFERAAQRFAAHQPKAGEVSPREVQKELRRLFSALDFLRPATESLDARKRRIEQASLDHYRRYQQGLKEHLTLPPPGTWIPLAGAPLDAKMIGLLCHDGTLAPTCHVEVAVRAREDLSLCGGEKLLQPWDARWDEGQGTNPRLFGVWKRGRFVRSEAELDQVSAGDVLHLELDVGAPKPNQDPRQRMDGSRQPWRIPIVVLAGTPLRVY
jgi:hypothetical protein